MSIPVEETIAEGPPISYGSLTVPYEEIHLSLDQISQANKYRYIVLSERQIRNLSVSGSMIPKILKLITSPFVDCSDDLDYWGLWVMSNVVQIPKYNLKFENEVSNRIDKEREFSTLKKELSYNFLNLDANGKLYQKGELVNDMEGAYSQIQKNQSWNSLEKYIFVNTPPLESKKVTSKVVKAYLNIKEFFEEKNYKVYAYFQHDCIDVVKNGYKGLPRYASSMFDKPLNKIKEEYIVSNDTTYNVEASSFGRFKDQVYSVSNLNDLKKDTAWVEGVPGNGINEEIVFNNFSSSSKKKVVINGFLVMNGYAKNKDSFFKNSRVKTFVFLINNCPDGIIELSDQMEAQKITLPNIVLKKNDDVILRIIDIYNGTKYQDTSITMFLPLLNMGEN